MFFFLSLLGAGGTFRRTSLQVANWLVISLQKVEDAFFSLPSLSTLEVAHKTSEKTTSIITSLKHCNHYTQVLKAEDLVKMQGFLLEEAASHPALSLKINNNA